MTIKENLSIKEAAIRILKEAETPLHANDIAKKIKKRGWWKDHGENPEASVRRCINEDMNNFKHKSPFEKTNGSTYRLRNNQFAPFQWIPFYEELATKLLKYKNDRAPLVAEIHRIRSLVGLSELTDRFSDGSSKSLNDICPFSVFGIFNQDIKDEKYCRILEELKKLLAITIEFPTKNPTLPRLFSLNSWFFGFEKDRRQQDIPNLWDLFEVALHFVEKNDTQTRRRFIEKYDTVISQHTVGLGKLTMGLFWIRPWNFVSLEKNSYPYIETNLGISIPKSGPKKTCTAEDYLNLLSTLKNRFTENVAGEPHSFPELALAAYESLQKNKTPKAEAATPETADVQTSAPRTTGTYSVTDIIKAGCFLSEPKLNVIFKRLKTKQNLILQGMFSQNPATGKTWLAKRLMYALSKTATPAPTQYSHVQFHANLSYEDFVQGYRPTEDGKLGRVDGPFLKLSEQARKNPGTPHVMIIEEINRGHPAQIFGELLTLLETDKRDSKYALHLTHQQAANEPYFIPQNLYVIGTMNTADRSLALIDFAFRRRFAFIDMKPLFNEQWVNFVANRNGIQKTELHKIATTMQALNNTLRDTLGANFQVGHSYCTPPHNEPIADAAAWFNDIVTTELSPLLKEYWFDAPDKVKQEVVKLKNTFA